MAETRKQKTGVYISKATRRQLDDLQEFNVENFTETIARAVEHLHTFTFAERDRVELTLAPGESSPCGSIENLTDGDVEVRDGKIRPGNRKPTKGYVNLRPSLCDSPASPE